MMMESVQGKRFYATVVRKKFWSEKILRSISENEMKRGKGETDYEFRSFMWLHVVRHSEKKRRDDSGGQDSAGNE